MKHLLHLTIALAVLALVTPCQAGQFTSGLGIPANEQFLLGEQFSGPFKVKAKNVGPVAVTIYAMDTKSKERRKITTAAPGESFEHDFNRGETAVLVNANAEAAKLDVVVSGPKVGRPGGFGMRYTPAESEERDSPTTRPEQDDEREDSEL